MRIVMIGRGYVGLVSGACLSEFGHDVVCVDNDAAKIAGLKQGVMPIYEPGLDEVVATNVKAGRLSFETDLKEAVPGAEAVFIAVGTPSRRGDGHADLSYVFAVAEEIAAGAYRLCRDRHQIDGSRRHQPQGGGDHPQDCVPTRISTSPPIRSSCAKARRSRISGDRTASWWAAKPNAPAR